MKYNEEKILKKLFWSKDKYDLTGNVFYNHTNEDFTSTKTIGLSRDDNTLEVLAICKIWLEFSFKELIYFNRNI